ncbi:unnamed protein product [Chondrus crispus]|uniref:Uncharacterized protein n=1 Tax=Chondrus crispus TaxID=2769 RepID=R7Q8F7_CHOCR|nr:unnamed protein product [Chondrus crispus]CDF34073.1 unnamed protein product [Chondrus crispus]|eukprot:XP_005713892.1 unnamed protein product [Chondrus crispus]
MRRAGGFSLVGGRERRGHASDAVARILFYSGGRRAADSNHGQTTRAMYNAGETSVKHGGRRGRGKERKAASILFRWCKAAQDVCRRSADRRQEAERDGAGAGLGRGARHLTRAQYLCSAAPSARSSCAANLANRALYRTKSYLILCTTFAYKRASSSTRRTSNLFALLPLRLYAASLSRRGRMRSEKPNRHSDRRHCSATTTWSYNLTILSTRCTTPRASSLNAVRFRGASIR